MLSILIPIYNFKVVDVVLTLKSQAEKLKIPFEILCFDDASSTHKEVNNKLQTESNIHYKELNNNIGRTKIRNLLAEEAKYSNLLFLDCDIAINKSNFLASYVPYFNSGNLVCGGVSYQKEAPEKTQQLRWKYGRKREEKKAILRNQSPYKSFTAFNLLAPKDIFQQINFNENINDYGHEDTLFGIELKKQGVTLSHIENPITHLGLDENQVFIEKTESGLKNLTILINENKINKQVKLYRYYNLFQPTLSLTGFIFKKLRKWSKNKLMKGSSSLFIFDLFKLSYILTSKVDQ